MGKCRQLGSPRPGVLLPLRQGRGDRAREGGLRGAEAEWSRVSAREPLRPWVRFHFLDFSLETGVHTPAVGLWDHREGRGGALQAPGHPKVAAHLITGDQK